MAIKVNLSKLNIFAIITWVMVIIVSLFLFQFIPPLFAPTGPAWQLLLSYWFPEVIFQTALLAFGSACLALIIGVSLGYWMTFYRIKWARLWDILLVLPLAMPAYLMAYLYVNMLNVTGSITLIIQQIFSWPRSGFVITNIFGAMVIFGLTLYPYVYLATRAYLSKQPQTMYAAAQSLGASSTKIFFRIVLPLLRPAMIGSAVLVMMEVINDYGLVHYFGLRVYATAIFQTWFNGNDLNAAVRLSVSLILMILAFLWLETSLRKSFKYSYPVTQIKPLIKRQLSRFSKTVFYGMVLTVLALALWIPFMQLIYWLPGVPLRIYQRNFIDGLFSSIILAIYPTLIIIGVAVALVNFQRWFPRPWKKWLVRYLTLGYSIPGAVIAVGMILLWIPFDRWLMVQLGWTSMLISGTLLLLIIALVIRFLAVATNLIDGTYHKIGMKYTLASYGLGQGQTKTFIAVDLPLISHGLIAASLIVIVDLLKELPLTLILRPFNFQTLATYLYQYAGDEQLNLASPMALMLILLTGLAVTFASDMMLKVNTYES
jgi:iron(III) transport system permease protein